MESLQFLAHSEVGGVREGEFCLLNGSRLLTMTDDKHGAFLVTLLPGTRRDGGAGGMDTRRGEYL